MDPIPRGRWLPATNTPSPPNIWGRSEPFPGLPSTYPSAFGAPALPAYMRPFDGTAASALGYGYSGLSLVPTRTASARPALQLTPHARPSVADLPFPTPRTDDERIENALWLIENNPSGERLARHTRIEGDSTIGSLPPPTTSRNESEVAADILAALERDAETTEAEPTDPTSGFVNLFGLVGSAYAQPRGRSGPRERTPSESLRLQFFTHWRDRLGRLEPNNPFLTTVQPPGHVPSESNIRDLARETVEAEARASSGRPPRPLGYLGPLPPRQGGETELTIGGRNAHRDILAPYRQEGYTVERSLASGARPDARRVRELDVELVEVKPKNQRAIRHGERQIERYSRELEAETGKPVRGRVEVYDLFEAIKRLLRGQE